MTVSALIKEDNVTSYRNPNPLASYLDAKERAKVAVDQHSEFFDNEEHIDRVVQASKIITEFFKRPPSHYNPRGINGKPFEAIKIDEVGHVLSRAKAETKNALLYKPLLDIGNVKVISKNGHLIVRVY